jgi:succinate dehydrogenase / fumarate reductase membrane anchor subunit
MKTRESTLWTWHLLTGAVILVLLGLHMFIMHLSGLGGAEGQDVLSYSSVMERSRDVAFVVIYVLLLGAALYHGLYGFRKIVFELTLPEGVERAITVLVIFVGLALFVIGSYATITAYTM